MSKRNEIPGHADAPKVLDGNSGEAEALSNGAVALRQLGKIDEALESLNRAIALRPDYAEAFNNRGNVLKDIGRFDEAIQSYNRAIAIRADYADAYNNRGNALTELKRMDEALASFDRAIREITDNPIFYSNRGNVLQNLGRFDAAVESYDQAIALNPNYGAAHANRANALAAVKQLDAALAGYDNAVGIDPNRASVWGNRGNILMQLKRFDDALDSYNRALRLEPNRAEFYAGRGNVLQAADRFVDAIASYDKALSLKGSLAQVYSNRGVARNALMRFDEAIDDFDAALALQPDHAEASWNRSLVHLLNGRLSLGWRDYEARKKNKEPVGDRCLSKPLWLGESTIAGKTILVHWEQGFGDTIQFCRYVALLEHAGSTVLFAPQAPLKTLMRGLHASPKIVDLDDTSIAYDVHCPLMSLPLAFGTDLKTIPIAKRYLSVDDAKLSEWRCRLGNKTKPRIGVVWNGSREHKSDRHRSIAFATFRRLLLNDRCEFLSLQKEADNHDAALLARAPIRHYGEALHDFSDTAALCSLTDLVISVDTAVAHLAGALGLPVWVLLPKLPDWRWMLDRADSPWYPSMRLYRQKVRGDWDNVIDEVRHDLGSLF